MSEAELRTVRWSDGRAWGVWGYEWFEPFARAMHAEARLVRGNTPMNSPRREDAQTLNELLELGWRRGVPVVHMARVLGVTATAVHLRLRRYGVRPLYPSQPALTAQVESQP